MGRHAAGGAIDQIDTGGFEMAGKFDGIVGRPAAFHPIGRGGAVEEGKVRGPNGADGFGDFEREAQAVGEGPPYSSVRWLLSGERNWWIR